jgi:hypothetical protein
VRKAPGYLRIAADSQGGEGAALLSLAELGLIAAVEDAAWLSDGCDVPANPDELALVLRKRAADVCSALTQRAIAEGCLDTLAMPGRLVATRLLGQKDKAVKTRRERVKAGLKGANARWADSDGKPDGNSDGKRDGNSDGKQDGSLIQPQITSTPSVGTIETADVDDPFVHEMKAAERAETEPRRRVLSIATRKS